MRETTHRIETAGVTLSVTEAGAGSPVVILHGFTGDASSMRGVARALAPRHRTLRIELIGHGRSAAPREHAPWPHYTMRACTAQLRGVLDALRIGRAHWLGYSMGGRAALAFAVAHPERVRSALLVGASAGIADARARAERVAADEALAARIERDGVEAFVDGWMALPIFASQKRLGEQAIAAARAQRLRALAHGLANSLRGMGSGAQPALHEALGGLDVPVCLVVGEEDAKFDAIAADLAARLPRARTERVPDAGHAAHLENPDAFARLARRFFADVDAQAGAGAGEVPAAAGDRAGRARAARRTGAEPAS